MRQYELLVLIGSGDSSNVFLARDTEGAGPDELVAVKVLESALAVDDAALGAFFNEARMMARLRHPNVLQLQAFRLIDGVHCLQSEFIAGADLARVLEEGRRQGTRLSIASWLTIARDLCCALEQVHPVTAHRDLTASNVLLGFDGVARLCDFGRACAEPATIAQDRLEDIGALRSILRTGLEGVPVQPLAGQTVSGLRRSIDQAASSAGVLMSASVVARELAALYESKMAPLTEQLAQARVGRADEAQLATLLDGEVLCARHLPRISAGATSRDPLGLDTALPAASPAPVDELQDFLTETAAEWRRTDGPAGMMGSQPPDLSKVHGGTAQVVPPDAVRPLEGSSSVAGPASPRWRRIVLVAVAVAVVSAAVGLSFGRGWW